MSLELSCQSPGPLPVDLEGFAPDRFQGKSLDDIKRFEVSVGNAKVTAGELFNVEGDPSDAAWVFTGDLSGAQNIGSEMASGRIQVDGAAGRYAGARMRGGELCIAGDAADLLGAELRGGTIVVGGDAGDQIGGPLPGSRLGMCGGTIRVHGSAGEAVGQAMRRGWITVGGDCGQLAGYRMRAGSLCVFGACGSRPGAEMVRGTIGLFGDRSPTLLPTFRPGCEYSPQFLQLMANELNAYGHRTPQRVLLHSGDLLTGGRGEILLPLP
ncbi:MAG: formylmethanofuran dehydrogenase subunit C [Planctomycetota bacterium]